MYYMHNSFTGRLIGVSHLKAYAPQGLQTLKPPEPASPYPPTWLKAEGIKSSHPVASATKGAPRPSSSTPPSPISFSQDGEKLPLPPERIRKLQQKFQVADGVPVHIKGGPRDKILYYLTLGLCVAGVAQCLNAFYTMAFPRRSAEQ